MLNELDRAAATPADTGAARPPISKTLPADYALRIDNGDPLRLAVQNFSFGAAVWRVAQWRACVRVQRLR
jgi:hypothetical protein